MKQFYLVLLFYLSCFSLFGQQAPQYSLYALNRYNFNPAYAGLDNSLSITGVFRKQWVDIAGAPTIQNLTAHLPLYILGGGFGINIENETQGAERTALATASYNYWLPINKKSLISIGISGGMLQKTLDGTQLRAPEGTYGPDPTVLNHNDGALPLGKENALAPIFNMGIYYQSQIFDIGISANNLTNSQVQLHNQEGTTTNISLNRNYFLIFASNLEIGRTLTLHPSILFKSDLIENQIELSALLKYNGNIFGGATFRGYNSNTVDAVVLIAGFKLNEKVTFAYGYDLTLSGLQSVSQGSHEIMLNYNLNKTIGAGIPPNIIYNPRFL